MLKIPLDAGGTQLAPMAPPGSEIKGEELQVLIPGWLAGKLRIEVGSLIIVDNLEGKFRITRSAANDRPPDRDNSS